MSHITTRFANDASGGLTAAVVAGERARYMAQSITVQGLALLLGLFSSIAAAQTFDNLQIPTDQCVLATAGSWSKEIIARGERQGRICRVTLPIGEFTKRYSYCALGGVWVGRESAHCEFGYYDRERTQVFFTSGPDQVCTFICVRR